MKNHLMIGLLWAASLPALAHEGHDDTPAVPLAGSSPQRLPDGSVLLPKASQRQLAIRTILTEQKQLPRTLELAGKVLADPNAGGKVQAAFAGRVEAGPRGLPWLGQPVRKGELLATIRPIAGAIETANQAAQAAELRAGKTLAEQRLARLQQLEGSVPRKEIDAARLEVQSLGERLAAVRGSIATAEALRAPVSGVVAAASVVAGQLVDARELLFEIVDPARLRVEAVAYDAGLATNIASASASPQAGQSFALDFVGAGRILREQAIPLQFRVRAEQGGAAPLAVGQPVTVQVQTRALLKGVAVPAAAVVKNASNQDIVWVHAEALRFAPKPVRAAPLDGASVIVLDGLAAGERVVVQGASLLNQVR